MIRRERELEIKERLNEERMAEYLFKQKELNQRLKDAITWPLNCLESESRLAEKLREVKVTPEFYRVNSIDDDRLLKDFINRPENKTLLKSIEKASEEVRLRAEGVMKYEFVVLKEREKNGIVREYMESEIKQCQNERNELQRERERYT